jgi:hypothetical protein
VISKFLTIDRFGLCDKSFYTNIDTTVFLKNH